MPYAGPPACFRGAQPAAPPVGLLLATLIVGPILVGCGESSAADGWRGSVEVVEGRTIVRNPADGIWNEGDEWRLVEERRIGVLEGDPAEIFGSIAAISVSDRGDIAILDGQAREVRVFDDGGTHLVTFGRTGDGPGEFRGPSGLHFDGLGRIWVVDAGANSYHLFTSDGEYQRSHPRDPSAGITLGNAGVTMPDGFLDPGIHVGTDRRARGFHIRVDTTGTVVDTVPAVIETHRTWDDILPFGLAPFTPRIISAVDVRADTWIASTDAYTIYRRNPAGDTIAEIRVDAPAWRFTAEQEDTITAVIDRFSSPVAPPVDRRTAGIAPQFVRSLHPDDEGRLFVRPSVPIIEGQNRILDVFDAEGRYLGRIHADFDLLTSPRPLFRSGRVYAASHDEHGAPIVIRAAIVER